MGRPTSVTPHPAHPSCTPPHSLSHPQPPSRAIWKYTAHIFSGNYILLYANIFRQAAEHLARPLVFRAASGVRRRALRCWLRLPPRGSAEAACGLCPRLQRRLVSPSSSRLGKVRLRPLPSLAASVVARHSGVAARYGLCSRKALCRRHNYFPGRRVSPSETLRFGAIQGETNSATLALLTPRSSLAPARRRSPVSDFSQCNIQSHR